jgi:hypothetical protein
MDRAEVSGEGNGLNLCEGNGSRSDGSAKGEKT